MAKCTLREFLDKANVEYQASQQDKIPRGWLSCADICRKTGMGKWLVLRRMNRLKKLEKVKVKDFRVLAGNNVRPVPHYYLPDYC